MRMIDVRQTAARRVRSAVDAVQRPATLWLGGCAVGEAGGLEASTALAAAWAQGLLAGPALAWGALGGAIEGAVLAVCQWAVLRRVGAGPRLAPFVAATLAAAAVVALATVAARAAVADAWAVLMISVVAGAMAGAFVGAVQSKLLPARRPLEWSVSMALGWAAAAGLSTAVWPLAQSGFGVPAAALSGLAVGLVGGLALGAATLPAFWALAQERAGRA